MANVASFLAILFSAFTIFQIILFERTDKGRKIAFGLIPLFVPILEFSVNLIFLLKGEKCIKKELKLLLIKTFLFDYFDLYEESTILNGTQIYCNQSSNTSCRSVKNIFPSFYSPGSKEHPDIISENDFFKIEPKSIKYKRRYIPKNNFSFTIFGSTNAELNVKEIESNLKKLKSEGELLRKKKAEDDRERSLNENLHSGVEYKYKRSTKEGLETMNYDHGLLDNFLLDNNEIDENSSSDDIFDYLGEGSFKVSIGGNKVLISKLGKYGNQINLTEVNFSTIIRIFNKLDKKNRLKRRVKNKTDITYYFLFSKSDRTPLDFKIGKLRAHYDFNHLILSMSEGSKFKNTQCHYNSFIKCFQMIYNLSCCEEYQEQGITTSVSFCERRKRNINHCYNLTDLIKMLKTKEINYSKTLSNDEIKEIEKKKNRILNKKTHKIKNKVYKNSSTVKMGESFIPIGLYGYKFKYFYNTEKEDSFLIFEGSLDLTVYKGESSLNYNHEDEQTSDNYSTIPYMLLNSVFGGLSKYFQIYFNEKSKTIGLSEGNKLYMADSLVKNNFDERGLEGVNNWQRKRMKSDLSYLKLKMGLDYLKRTDTKIPPSSDAIRVLKMMEREKVEKISESDLIANAKLSDIPINCIEIVNKVFSKIPKINRSLGHIKKISQILLSKPTSIKGEIRKENKIEKTYKDSLQELTNKVRKKKMTEGVYKLKLLNWQQEYKQCKNEMLDKLENRLKSSENDLKTNLKLNTEVITEKYNVNVIKRDYKKALCKSMNLISQNEELKQYQSIVNEEMNLIKKKIEECKSVELKDFSDFYRRSEPEIFRKRKHIGERKKIEIKENRLNYFLTKNSVVSLENKFEVLNKGEKKIKEIIESINKDPANKELMENYHLKTKNCLEAYGIEKIGLYRYNTKRQNKQNEYMISMAKNKVKKEKIKDFKVNFTKGFNITVNLDCSEFEREVKKFSNRLDLVGITTYKPKENMKLNHPNVNLTLKKEVNLFKSLCVKRKQDELIFESNGRKIKAPKFYHFTLEKFGPLPENLKLKREREEKEEMEEKSKNETKNRDLVIHKSKMEVMRGFFERRKEIEESYNRRYVDKSKLDSEIEDIEKRIRMLTKSLNVVERRINTAKGVVPNNFKVEDLIKEENEKRMKCRDQKSESSLSKVK